MYICRVHAHSNEHMHDVARPSLTEILGKIVYRHVGFQISCSYFSVWVVDAMAGNSNVRLSYVRTLYVRR